MHHPLELFVKKRFIKKMTACALGLNMIVAAGASGVSAAETPPLNRPAIQVGSVSGQPGDEVDVDVSIHGNSGLAGIDIVIEFDPAQVTPLSISEGILSPLVSNLDDAQVTIENYITATWVNASNITDNGVLYTIKFKIQDSADPGGSALKLTHNIVSEEYTKLDFEPIEGIVTVASKILYGDINGDGRVETKDLILLLQYLAGWKVNLTPDQKEVADVYYDGALNTLDAIKLAQFLAEWVGIRLGPNDVASTSTTTPLPTAAPTPEATVTTSSTTTGGDVSSNPVFLVETMEGFVFDDDADSGELVIWAPHGGISQMVELRPTGDGYFYLVFLRSGKVIETIFVESSMSTPITVGGFTGDELQQWKLEDVPGWDGWYNVVNRGSGLLLDVLDAEYKDGTPLQAFVPTASDAQMFGFIPAGVDALPPDIHPPAMNADD
ncbi:MAG: RICIN domain-containing protein [Clostridiales bacterium]|jgi:hypothetical protein|nr:RICIN domain-containing protein [Clostridiales bacterium]